MEAVGEHFREIRVKSLVQEIRVIALVDENEDGKDDTPTVEKELVIDSLRRPLPIPYNEEQ